MPGKVQIKCAIAGCHRRLRMTLAQREELRRVGREHNATSGLICPAHVKAAFNYEFDDIDIDVPMGEFLVEASKEIPRWRVILTPLPEATGAAGQPAHAGARKQGYLVQRRRRATPGFDEHMENGYWTGHRGRCETRWPHASSREYDS